MRILQRSISLIVIGLGSMAAIQRVNCFATDTNDLPHFQEVFRLLRANLPNASEEDLNRAAVHGLLSEFYPRVILVTNGAPASPPPESSLLSKTRVYDQLYGYLRVARVATGLADQVKSSYEKLDATNRLKGVVLDLRFADGQDYAAAASVAEAAHCHRAGPGRQRQTVGRHGRRAGHRSRRQRRSGESLLCRRVQSVVRADGALESDEQCRAIGFDESDLATPAQ